MRILAIRGENVASLETFDVDFRQEPLRSAGLFAIVGPTGSGKSSLLDAMCLALYQRAPRLDGLSGQVAKVPGAFGEIPQDNVRNLLRRGALSGWAACDFRGRDGQDYTARWGYRAPRRKGASLQEELSLVRLADAQVLVTGANRKTEFSARVEDLLGLTWSQFVRTVLLAQGRFAEFLKAPDDERARLLEKLTGTEIYARLSRVVFQRQREEEAAVRDLEVRLSTVVRLAPPERDALAQRAREIDRTLPRSRARLAVLTEIVSDGARLEVVVASGESAAKRRDALSSATGEVAMRRGRGEELLRAAELALAEAEPELREAGRLDEALVHLGRSCQAAREGAETARRDAATARDALRAHETRLAAMDREVVVLDEWIAPRERLRPVAADWSRIKGLLERMGRLRLARLDNEARLAEAGRILAESEEPSRRARTELDEAVVRLGGRDPEDLPRLVQENLRRRYALERLAERRALEAEIASMVQAEDEARLGRAATEERIPSLRSAHETARTMVEATRVAASGNVSHLRSTLREGQACPVCGSLEHPRTADGDGRLRALLSEQEIMLRAREVALADALSEAKVLEERLRHASEQVALRRAKLAKVDGIEEILLEIDDGGWLNPGADLDVLARETEAERSRLEEAQVAASSVARARDVLARLERRGAGAELLMGQRRERAVELVAEIGECIADLDAAFGAPTWRIRWEEEPETYRQGLERQVDEWNEALRRRERLVQDVLEARVRGEWLVKSKDAQEILLVEAERALDEASRLADASRMARAGLLGGRMVPQVRRDLDDAVARAREGLDRLRTESEAIGQELAVVERDVERLAEEARALRLSVARATEQAGLPADTPAPQAGVRQWQDERDRLSQELEEALREQATVLQKLATDDEGARREHSLRVDLDRGREVFDRWARLASEIGSADGRKFCAIAQRFTLERLLELADRELSVLAPRYALRRLGDSMSFGVLDRASWDEVRAVHTLSGGETFLVSLALALALSGLSGSAVEVGTLFIDEGFGTLDPQTLRQVMDALSNLQAQGRQVGLITHVEELKELIPVRVEMVRTGPGSSEVRVSG